MLFSRQISKMLFIHTIDGYSITVVRDWRQAKITVHLKFILLMGWRDGSAIKAHTAMVEDPILIPSTHIGQPITAYNYSSRRIQYFWGIPHSMHSYACMHTHIFMYLYIIVYIKKNIVLQAAILCFHLYDILPWNLFISCFSHLCNRVLE